MEWECNRPSSSTALAGRRPKRLDPAVAAVVAAAAVVVVKTSTQTVEVGGRWVQGTGKGGDIICANAA